MERSFFAIAKKERQLSSILDVFLRKQKAPVYLLRSLFNRPACLSLSTCCLSICDMSVQSILSSLFLGQQSSEKTSVIQQSHHKTNFLLP